MNISKIRIGSSAKVVSLGPVDIASSEFPDKPTGHSQVPPCTVDNVRHLLDENGITARYNEIAKRVEIAVPWATGTADNGETVSLTHILSLASRHGMPTGLVPAMVEAIADENAYNPAGDWMRSRPWDGVDRLQVFFETITPQEGYPIELRDTLMRRWLLSVAVAATGPDGVRFRGVLTLQGPQGIGKTSWGLRLINNPTLAQQLIKVDHHLDPGNKDSLLGAINHLICEVGELESSLRRDIARLKGFLTAGTDKVRRPYARAATVTQRRTVFYATVNASDFLVDDTGNSRFWTIPCTHINHDHSIDMQQVFAQCLSLLEAGEQWWLTADEEQALERQNSKHRSFSLVRDRLSAMIDLDADPASARYMTASDVLREADFMHPTNAQAKEAAAYLRSLFGDSSRVQGIYKWRVPLRSEAPEPSKQVVPQKSKFD